jgi:hypothetical protein
MKHGVGETRNATPHRRVVSALAVATRNVSVNLANHRRDRASRLEVSDIAPRKHLERFRFSELFRRPLGAEQKPLGPRRGFCFGFCFQGKVFFQSVGNADAIRVRRALSEPYKRGVVHVPREVFVPAVHEGTGHTERAFHGFGTERSVLHDRGWPVFKRVKGHDHVLIVTPEGQVYSIRHGAGARGGNETHGHEQQRR